MSPELANIPSLRLCRTLYICDLCKGDITFVTLRPQGQRTSTTWHNHVEVCYINVAFIKTALKWI